MCVCVTKTHVCPDMLEIKQMLDYPSALCLTIHTPFPTRRFSSLVMYLFIKTLLATNKINAKMNELVRKKKKVRFYL